MARSTSLSASANAIGGLQDLVRGNNAGTVKGNSDGIDPDYRRTAAAVWRWRRILWSQAWVLVIDFPRCRSASGVKRKGILIEREVGVRVASAPWFGATLRARAMSGPRYAY
jgi:hypothetical protein